MNRRLQRLILLLYPRPVRKDHGPEMLALIDELIAHDRRSPITLSLRLAADGLLQRATSTATVWTVVALLITTSLGGLAISDFATANAQQATTPTARPPARVRHPHRPISSTVLPQTTAPKSRHQRHHPTHGDPR